MVAAEKKNTDELRIWIDRKDLTQALMRPHHALKTVVNILIDTSGAGAKVFSRLDAEYGFSHIRLNKNQANKPRLALPMAATASSRFPTESPLDPKSSNTLWNSWRKDSFVRFL